MNIFPDAASGADMNIFPDVINGANMNIFPDAASGGNMQILNWPEKANFLHMVDYKLDYYKGKN